MRLGTLQTHNEDGSAKKNLLAYLKSTHCFDCIDALSTGFSPRSKEIISHDLKLTSHICASHLVSPVYFIPHVRLQY
jgi:hypothetical protein